MRGMAVLLLAAGCLKVEPPSRAYRCTVVSSCPEGLSCTQGYCLAPGEQPPTDDLGDDDPTSPATNLPSQLSQQNSDMGSTGNSNTGGTTDMATTLTVQSDLAPINNCAANPNGFVVETIESAGDVGKYAAIKIDATNAIHLAYAKDATLGYAKRQDGGQWAFESASNQTLKPYPVSMGVDGTGAVHVSYIAAHAQAGSCTGWCWCNFKDSVRYVARPAGGGWSPSIETEVIWDQPYHHTASAVSSGGDVYTFTYDNCDGGAEVRKKSAGGAFSSSTLIEGGGISAGYFNSAAVGPTGVAYTCFDNYPNLRCGWNNGSGWTLENAATVNTSDAWNSMAVDSAGGIHVVVHKSGTLTYRYRAPNGGWTGATIGNASNAALSLAVDSALGVHVAYTSGGLQYAYKPAGGTFSTKTVDGAASSWPAIAVDGGGKAYIAYHDSTALDLKLARPCP